MIDTQNETVVHDEDLIVGITKLRTKFTVDNKIFIPTIRISLTLDNNKRGAHMSRFIESIGETVENTTTLKNISFEDTCKNILKTLRAKHPFKSAEITVSTEYAKTSITPHTKRTSTEVYDIEIKVFSQLENHYIKTISVTAIGSSACPHALANNEKHRTHLQRSIGKLSITSDIKNSAVNIDTMIEILNASFSSPVHTLLKSTDEQAIVNRMFENPKFVEDIAREASNYCKKAFTNCDVEITIENEESIHTHNVFANMFLHL